MNTRWNSIFNQFDALACNRKMNDRRMRRRRSGDAPVAAVAIALESLETRVLLSSASVLSQIVAEPTLAVEKAATPTGATGYTPSQMLAAYGFNLTSGNGAGQTIAIVDAYHDPTIQSDLHAFDVAFGLADPPSFKVVSQTGSTTNLPSTDPSSDKQSDWEVEESLDVEWAHALAPGANIILVEANSASYADLLTAVKTAASLPGVSVVSMSWGGSEFASEASYDSYFTTPAGHQGVTFVASTGDEGAPGGYPAYSPNVLAVGGTSLTLNSSGGYVSETAWSSSGGGVSQYESKPSYQNGIVTQTSTKRAIPDVSFDADPNTGVPIYDSFSFGTTNPWAQLGGTSFGAPAWASIIAIANQQRVQNGLGTLDGATQTIPMLYQLDRSNPSAFHDITSGSNGFSAGAGYDLVTGLGSPVVNRVVAGLVGSSTSSTSSLSFSTQPTSGTAGQVLGTITVAIKNQNGQIVTSDNSTVTLSIASGPGSFASGTTLTATAVNGVATFSNVILNVAGTYTFTASDSGRTSATSSAVTIAAARASKVVFQALPSTGTVGTVVGSVKVAIEDQYGNVVTTSNASVTLNASGAGFRAGSTTTVTAVNGVATFNNLAFASAGSYTLNATSSGLATATSATITITAGLSAPQNVTLVALSSTSAQLSWSSVTSATGYRVYQVIGSQQVLLGTVSASTTSVQISSLAAGATVSFFVQAYNSSTSVNSAVVSTTLPAPASSLTLSATLISSNTVKLSWNSLSNTTAYQIYYSIGNSTYFLTTVNSATTSVQVTGLVPGTNYKFQIVAIRSVGGTVYSNWVTVNSAAARAHSSNASSFWNSKQQSFWDWT